MSHLRAVLLALLTVAASAGEALREDCERPVDGWIAGWTRGDAGKLGLREESGNRFLRVALPTADAAMVTRALPLEAGWTQLQFSLRIRGEALKRGEQGWMTGRMEIGFHGADGKRVGGWPWLGLGEDGSTGGWRTLRLREPIPEGASEVRLTLGMWGASGTVDFDDLTVTPIESAASRAMRVDPKRADVLDNPAFAAGPDGLPAGWTAEGPREAFSVSAGGVLRVASAKPARIFLSQRQPLHPGTERIDVLVDNRASDLAVVEEGDWRRGANIVYVFYDPDGRELAVNHFGNATAKDWSTGRHEKVAVPAGACELEVRLGLFAASGVAEFRNLRVPPTVVLRKPGEIPAAVAELWAKPAVSDESALRSRLDLAGEWQFQPGRAASAREPQADAWGFCKVPGSWHDDITAKAMTPAWTGFKPRDTAKAWYRRTVPVPAAWKGRTIELDLVRVSTDAKVWVNGAEAGQVAWPWGVLDVTALVKPGEVNTVQVMVLAMNDRSEVVSFMGYVDEPKQKAELDSRGIIGAIALRTRPAGAHLADLQLRPSVAGKKLDVALDFAGLPTDQEVTVTARMLDEQGKEEKSFTGRTRAVQGSGTATVSFPWPDPRLWDWKQPNRYTAVIAVQGATFSDERRQEFGFRDFAIDGRRFVMNGSEIRLRPGNIQYGVRPKQLLERNLNLAHMWPGDQIRRGTRSDYDLDMIAEADRIGMPVAANLAHLRWHVDHWGDAGARAEWLRIMEQQVRMHRNHPSVVMYTHSGNAFQWQGDGDPWDLGIAGAPDQQEYAVARNRFREAAAEVKKLDAKPIYAHFGADTGDVWTSNLYLNFIPLQEREEWISHWAGKGTMPYLVVEMGLPLYSSVMRGRDGYTHQGHSEPFPSEWGAAYFGAKAYAEESPEFRKLVADRYKGQDRDAEYQPHIRQDSAERIIERKTAFASILDLFITNTWRSWRTQGMTGGMIPWHHDQAPALARVNGPTLAWICGAGGLPVQSGADASAITDKTHHYAPGAAIAKQVAVINDQRRELAYSVRWRVLLDGKELAAKQVDGRIQPGSTLFHTLAASLPGQIAGSRLRGSIAMTARIGDDEHVHELPFDVIAPAPPVRIDVALLDVEGATGAWLKAQGCNVTPWGEGEPTAPVAVVGRHALSSGRQIPGDIGAWVARGGRLLVMSQDRDWTAFALHLRTAPHVSRRVFPVDPAHPLLGGLDQDNLRDWNGHGTACEAYPSYPGFDWVPNLGWHWGNRHAVSAVPLEKPHLLGFRPLLESEFDGAYSPLMELDHGRGRITLCTLDVEGRTAADPAAQRLGAQLLAHVASAPVRPRLEAVYLGGDAGAGALASLGVVHRRAEALPPQGLAILGPDARVADDDLRGFLQRGGMAVSLRRTGGAAPLGVKLRRAEAFHGSLSVPRWPEVAGLSASDLRWRADGEAWLAEAGPGAELGADGQLARVAVGQGALIVAQLGPDAVPADGKRYFRLTRWRQTRALVQVLANCGAMFTRDADFVRLLKTPDHGVNLAGHAWQAKMTNPLVESPTRQWHAPQALSAAARALLDPAAPDSAFAKVWVPAYLENYGPDWRWKDGETVFRRVIDWPAHAAGRELQVGIGRVDETETTFWNGQEVGGSKQWLFARSHRVPGALVKAGRNVLALRNWDEGIHGGMCGSPDRIFVRVVAPDPGFYHPDYIPDDVVEGENEAAWAETGKRWRTADNPYRYYRW